jgi:succinyl-diaminopimelate desuccinylase
VSQTVTPEANILASLVDRDRLVGRLEALARIDSENPPGREAEVAGLVRSYCEELALDVSEHEAEPNRPNILARWHEGDGPILAYCSHIDVVPAGDPGLWDSDPYGAIVKDGHMHGRGTADAKGPVAAALEAVAVLKAAGAPMAGTLELELVADEETMGFKGAGYLVGEGIVGPDVAIVGEPTSLRVVRAQRGACWLRITARGRASHGSAPERGINAIQHMAELVLHLEETLGDAKHDLLGGPSINVGTIRGGEKINVVPASCIIEVDRRTVPGETSETVLAEIDRALELTRERFPELDVRVEVPFACEPFEISEDARIVKLAAAAVQEATGAPAELIGFRGASDARFLFEAGAEVVVMGPGDIGVAHTAHESIDLHELEQATVAYALAFARLLAPTR